MIPSRAILFLTASLFLAAACVHVLFKGRRSHSHKKIDFKKNPILLFVLFGVIGSVLLLYVNAAEVSISLQPELSTAIASPAVKISDPLASDGQAVKFGVNPANSYKAVVPNSRFAWKLVGAPNETIMDSEIGPKVYDFDYLNSNATQIARIKAKGITVICYFSAGTDELWRPDHNLFKPGDTFGPLPGWEDEYIVDTRSANVRNIMYNRMVTMKNLGCDGIEPDNIDAYTNTTTAIPLNETTTLDYIQFLTDTAHNLNMSVALKNGGDLVAKNAKLPNGKTLVQAHDFVIVEQCYQYGECDKYRPFITANKAVFIVEYSGTASTWASSSKCADANTKNYDAYLMNQNLDGPRYPCRTQ